MLCTNQGRNTTQTLHELPLLNPLAGCSRHNRSKTIGWWRHTFSLLFRIQNDSYWQGWVCALARYQGSIGTATFHNTKISPDASHTRVPWRIKRPHPASSTLWWIKKCRRCWQYWRRLCQMKGRTSSENPAKKRTARGRSAEKTSHDPPARKNEYIWLEARKEIKTHSLRCSKNGSTWVHMDHTRINTPSWDFNR